MVLGLGVGVGVEAQVTLLRDGACDELTGRALEQGGRECLQHKGLADEEHPGRRQAHLVARPRAAREGEGGRRLVAHLVRVRVRVRVRG